MDVHRLWCQFEKLVWFEIKRSNKLCEVYLYIFTFTYHIWFIFIYIYILYTIPDEPYNSIHPNGIKVNWSRLIDASPPTSSIHEWYGTYQYVRTYHLIGLSCNVTANVDTLKIFCWFFTIKFDDPSWICVASEYSGESIEETLSDGEHLTATVTPVKIADPQHKSKSSVGTDRLLVGWFFGWWNDTVDG